MNYARLVLDFRKTRGIWPDIIVADPTCLHHVAFEIAAIASVYPSLPSMSICHDPCLPSGYCMACTTIDFLTFDPSQLDPEHVGYVAKFHPEALN